MSWEIYTDVWPTYTTLLSGQKHACSPSGIPCDFQSPCVLGVQLHKECWEMTQVNSLCNSRACQECNFPGDPWCTFFPPSSFSFSSPSSSIVNRFFFHTIYPDQNFLSLHFFQLSSHLSSCPDPLLLHLSSEKSKPPRKTSKNGKTKYNTTSPKSSHRNWMRQPSRKKRVPRGGKRVKETSAPTVRNPITTPRLIAWCRPMQAPYMTLQCL